MNRYMLTILGIVIISIGTRGVEIIEPIERGDLLAVADYLGTVTRYESAPVVTPIEQPSSDQTVIARPDVDKPSDSQPDAIQSGANQPERTTQSASTTPTGEYNFNIEESYFVPESKKAPAGRGVKFKTIGP